MTSTNAWYDLLDALVKIETRLEAMEGEGLPDDIPKLHTYLQQAFAAHKALDPYGGHECIDIGGDPVDATGGAL